MVTRADDAEPRRRVPALLRVGAAVCTFAYGLNAIVPLFPAYAERFGLVAGDLTLAFSAYSMAMLPVLLATGHVSDRVGRRPVVVIALVAALTAAVVLASARGLAWLIAGRALQGLAGGLFWSTAAAYARDLVTERRRDSASLLVTVGFTAGLAVGAVTTGALAQATGSVVVPWAVSAVLVVVGALTVAGERETVPPPRSWPGFSFQVHLPTDHRSAFVLFLIPVTFVLVAVSVVVLNLTPALVGELLPDAVSSVSGIAVALQLSLATAAQLLTRRARVLTLIAVGCVTMVTGALLLPVSVALAAPVLLVAGFAGVGVSTGLVFRATLALAERMSTPRDRGAVMAAYNVVLYAGIGAPAILAGRLTDVVGVTTTLVSIALLGGVTVLFAYTVGRRHLDPTLDPKVQPSPNAVQVDGSRSSTPR